MIKHPFIFNPGNWIGEGKITINMVEDELHFHTSWGVQNKDFAGKIFCGQDIQIQGLGENMRNELTFFDVGQKEFSVEMENQNIGKIVGTGVYDDKTIGWEFRNNNQDFEGYETYTLEPDGSYKMRGEYITSDQFRTIIEARLWIDNRPEANEDEEKEEEGPF
jgi:hypothetical protein